MRSVGLDVHRDFCEVAIIDPAGGRVEAEVPAGGPSQDAVPLADSPAIVL